MSVEKVHRLRSAVVRAFRPAKMFYCYCYYYYYWWTWMAVGGGFLYFYCTPAVNRRSDFSSVESSWVQFSSAQLIV